MHTDDEPEKFDAVDVHAEVEAEIQAETKRKAESVTQALNKLKEYYEDRFKFGKHTYSNDEYLEEQKFKKLIFKWDDPRVVDEVTRILKIKNSMVVLIQEGKQFEIYYYANESTCFIATAAYGSSFSPEVMAFRKFRDDMLLTSKIGTVFVNLYYRISPPLASFIQRDDFLRAVTKYLILAPILRLLKATKIAS